VNHHEKGQGGDRQFQRNTEADDDDNRIGNQVADHRQQPGDEGHGHQGFGKGDVDSQ